jgi:hypothetical protein
MGFGKFLGAAFKKAATAPIKAAIAPVKKTISSTKQLAGGNIKGAFKSLNLASPSNVKAGVKAFRSYANPLDKTKKPKPIKAATALAEETIDGTT